jgi:RNA polymerase sigma-70 factor, ECF subfamily
MISDHPGDGLRTAAQGGQGLPPSASGTEEARMSGEDRRTVEALLRGDEATFASLVDRLSPQMLRVALIYVPSRAVAEDVVQDAWLAVLGGLHGFEGRSSLKTWILRILMNQAISRGKRERRSVPFSALFDAAREPAEPSVEPARFVEAAARGRGYWATPPAHLDQMPEERLLSHETLSHIGTAIQGLPPNQREVITLRDVEGWTSREVCNVLGIGETNQRVLLHRARSKVRRALEQYFEQGMITRASPRLGEPDVD